jgi:hypothetical protein
MLIAAPLTEMGIRIKEANATDPMCAVPESFELNHFLSGLSLGMRCPMGTISWPSFCWTRAAAIGRPTARR